MATEDVSVTEQKIKAAYVVVNLLNMYTPGVFSLQDDKDLDEITKKMLCEFYTTGVTRIQWPSHISDSKEPPSIKTTSDLTNALCGYDIFANKYRFLMKTCLDDPIQGAESLEALTTNCSVKKP